MGLLRINALILPVQLSKIDCSVNGLFNLVKPSTYVLYPFFLPPTPPSVGINTSEGYYHQTFTNNGGNYWHFFDMTLSLADLDSFDSVGIEILVKVLQFGNYFFPLFFFNTLKIFIIGLIR